MHHYPFSAFETIADLGDDAITLPCRNMTQSRATVLLDEQRPFLPIPEQRCQRHGQDVVDVPQHDSGFDLVAVPQPLSALFTREVYDDVDALLLDAERRDLEETEGLSQARPERLLVASAPRPSRGPLACFTGSALSRPSADGLGSNWSS
jgi:hypothetical protein